MYYVRDLIRKKRDKKELTEDEINFFIYAYNRSEILREQAASLLTLMYTNGLTEKEMAYLALAVAETGEKREIYEISNRIVDIHPIGGMDDKITIMLLAILNSLNMPAAKIIGREVGIIDKLLGIKTIKMTNENMKKISEEINHKIIILEEPENTAPVENKLYKLRNDIACNDDISLIAISLMSQKIALGVRNMVFDISYGEYAYVKTLHDAQKLSRYLIQMGQKLNRGVRCIITKLDEPVGKFFGNTLEIKEAIEALNGNMMEDVKELVIELACRILSLLTNNNMKNNKQIIINAIESGQAYMELINFLTENNIDYGINAKDIIPVVSNEDGYIKSINMSLIRTTAKYLNAVRYSSEDKLAAGAGIEFEKKIGDYVKKGDIIGYIYTNDNTKINTAVQNLKESYAISKNKVKKISRIVETF